MGRGADDRDPVRTGDRGGCSRGRRERGAALVEAAIILPLVLLLTFGTIEFARMYNASSTVAQAARAGGRTASALPTDAGMPAKAASAAAPVLSRMSSDAPEELWVYRVRGSDADGRPPATCGADCVSFAWDDGSATFTPVGGDGAWDASANEVCAGTFDQVGIHVRTNVRYITGLFGSERSITDWAVFRFEPASQEWCATR